MFSAERLTNLSVVSFLFMILSLLQRSTLFPYTTLFRSFLFLAELVAGEAPDHDVLAGLVGRGGENIVIDRKSTRLNSSHVRISYAVFCLKKKIYHSSFY